MSTTIDDCLKVAQAASLAAQSYASAGEKGLARVYADHCAVAFHFARQLAGVAPFDHSSTFPTRPETTP